MPNTLLTISMVSRELLMMLKGTLAFSKGVNRQWESQYAVSGAKIGTTLQIRKTPRHAVQSGPPFSAENYVEETVPLVINQQKHVDVEFTSTEMTLSLDDWSRRIARPAAARLAAEIDKDGLALYYQVANSVLSPTTATDKFYQYNLAHAILLQEGGPMDGDYYVCLEPLENAAVVNANRGLFQSSERIKEQYEEGIMGRMTGADWLIDQNVAAHTTGARGGAPQVGAASQTGATLNVTGFTAAAAPRLARGDVFTMVGVYAVNPQTLLSTGRLRDFTVTANVSSAADGTAAIPIWPPIIAPPNPAATVTASPAASTPLVLLGTANTTYAQNLFYHKNAFTLAIVPMVMPFSGQASRADDPGFAASLRVWKDSNISTDTHPSRTDALYGWAVQQPELAVRVWSVPGVS
jgi:P22 coat protein - gene protein 5